MGQEFFRCSYFVYNNCKEDIQFDLSNFDINLLFRTFLTDKPRILVKDIEWDNMANPDVIQKIDSDPQILKAREEAQELLRNIPDPFSVRSQLFVTES